MVKHPTRGSITLELIVAMSILVATVIPLGLSFASEQRLCRVYYWRAVAMEIVDGEMEVLAAGEWRAFKQGSQPYSVHAESAKNLPPGKFVLTVGDNRIRLEWIPDNPRDGVTVAREVTHR